ncbi:MAG: NFYB/HAP3 family transcription factor subunit [archaeon]|nr:NFYB/HAP3 family transcription factor subunit [archaeon]
MKKNKEKDNTLIKRKGLSLFVKSIGIKRISPKALNLIEKTIKNNLEILLDNSRENATINGRKTITEEDIKNAQEKKEETLEI